MRAYQSFEDGGIGDQWCIGDLDTARFAHHLQSTIGRRAADIEQHLRRC